MFVCFFFPVIYNDSTDEPVGYDHHKLPENYLSLHIRSSHHSQHFRVTTICLALNICSLCWSQGVVHNPHFIDEKTKAEGNRGTGLSSHTREDMKLEGRLWLFAPAFQRVPKECTSGGVFQFLTLPDYTNKWVIFVGSFGPYMDFHRATYTVTTRADLRWTKTLPEREEASGSTKVLYLFLTKREKALHEMSVKFFNLSH